MKDIHLLTDVRPSKSHFPSSLRAFDPESIPMISECFLTSTYYSDPCLLLSSSKVPLGGGRGVRQH